MPSHNKPPAGYRPIPNSRTGGYVKGEGRDARYWYPDRRAATQAAADIVGRVTLHAKHAHAAGWLADSTGDPKHSATWAAMQNQAARAYQEELPGHLDEIERHLKAEQASLGRGRGGGRVRAASELPNRKAMQQELIAAHQAEGTATPIGRERPGQYTVPYVATPHAMGTTALDVSSANDAQLLLAYAGTAVRHTKHAARLSAAIYGDSPMSKSAPKPPPGYTPIPESASGGYHRRTSKGWVHWYPSRAAAQAAVTEHYRKAARLRDMVREVDHVSPDLGKFLSYEEDRHQRLGDLASHAARNFGDDLPIESNGHMVREGSEAHENIKLAAHCLRMADGAKAVAPKMADAKARAEVERDGADYHARGTAALDAARSSKDYLGEVGDEHAADPDPQHTHLLRGRELVREHVGNMAASARAGGDHDAAARLEVVGRYLSDPDFRDRLSDHSFATTYKLGKALVVLAKATRPQLV